MSLQIKRKYIEDAAIDAAKLSVDAVEKEKIKDDAVDNNKIQLLAGGALRAVSLLNGAQAVSLLSNMNVAGKEVVAVRNPDTAQLEEVAIKSVTETKIAADINAFKLNHHDQLATRVTDTEDDIATLNAADTVSGSVAQKIKAAIDGLVDSAPTTLDTLKKISAYIDVTADSGSEVLTAILGAVGDAKDEIKGAVSDKLDSLEEVQGAIESLVSASGLAIDVNTKAISYSASSTAGGLISAAVSIHDATKILANAVQSIESDLAAITNPDSGSNAATAAEIQRIEDAVGLSAEGNYIASVLVGAELIHSATTVKSADEKLAQAIKALAVSTGQAVSSTGVASFVAPAGLYVNNAGSLKEAISTLDGKIATLNGSDATEGSVAKALADAKDYVDNVLGMSATVLDTFTTLQNAMTVDTSAATGIVQAISENRDVLNKLSTAVAAPVDAQGVYQPEASSNYLAAASSLHNSVMLLDSQVKTNANDIESLELALGQEVADRGSAVEALAADLTFMIQEEADIRARRVFKKQASVQLTAAQAVAGNLGGFDLDHEILADSSIVAVGRLLLHEGLDYEIVASGSVSKIQFLADFMGSEEKVEAGDIIHVRYMVK